MSSDDVRAQLVPLIEEVFELSMDQVIITDDLDLGYLGDSLQRLELLALIERRFGISMASVDIQCFGHLVAVVEGRLRGSHG